MARRFAIDKGRMLAHQRAFWELPNFVKLLVGGYGCGKTHIGALRSIWSSSFSAPIPALYVSPTYKQAKKTVVISIKEILSRAGVRYRYNKTDHEFFIPGWNGTIWIASGDEPESLKGPNLATAGIDEPFLMKEEILSVVLSRLRHPDARLRELFLTGTPEQLNWGYELAQNVDGRYDLGTVIGRTADNVHLPGQFVAMLERAFDENQRAAYMEGRFVNLVAGRVYRHFERSMVVERAVPQGTVVMAGIDFNVDYLTAELFFVAGAGVHFFDEIRLSDATTFELAERLHERFPGITVFPDPSGRDRRTSSLASDFTILRDKGFRVEARPAHPPVRSRVNAVNRLCREGLLTVSPKCAHLLRDMDLVRWRNGEIDKVTNPALTHASDAAGYAVEKLFPVRLPVRVYGNQPGHWRA